MATVETIIIETDNGPVVINKSDFDPASMKEHKAPVKRGRKPKGDK